MVTTFWKVIIINLCSGVWKNMHKERIDFIDFQNICYILESKNGFQF